MMLPTYRDCLCASLGVLWKVQDSNLRCLKERSLLRFTSLSIAPAFVLSANLPNMSILIALCFRKPANLAAGWGK